MTRLDDAKMMLVLFAIPDIGELVRRINDPDVTRAYAQLAAALGRVRNECEPT